MGNVNHEHPDELMHHGTKGMRWGVRRYQNKDGSLTKAGEKRYNKELGKLKAAKAKLAKEKRILSTKKKTQSKIDKLEADKKKIEEQKKALKEEKKRVKSGKSTNEEQGNSEEAKKQHEAARKKAMESGSATDVLKFKGEFSKAEMDAIQSRLNWEKNMSDMSARELATGKSKTQKMMEGIGKATNYAETGIKAYNTLANIFNGVKGDNILPRISTNIKDDNINARKASKKERQKQKEADERRAKQEAEGEAKRQERAKKKEAKETSEAKEDKTVYEGTVEGVGTSSSRNKSTNSTKKKPDGYYDPIDIDEPISGVPAVYTRTGQSWIAGYLEDNS